MKTKATSPVTLAACIVVPLIVLMIPHQWIPVANITIVEQRVLALFAFAALFWILEPIPIYATSMLIILLELLVISDSSLVFLKGNGEQFGVLMPFKEIMASLAAPVILLFLGGFFLASAATKYRLDQGLASVLLRRFGTKPKMVLLGVMSLSALISMFMSNTATTAMMLSILIPVLKVFPSNDKGKIAFVIAVPFAANLGGIGTPIGTPANAIALKFFIGENAITFAQWMAFGVPFVIIMIFIAWVVLLVVFPISVKELKLNIEGSFSKSRKAIVVYVTFIVTILLWLTDFLHGLNSYTVALVPVAVFLSTGIVNKEDLKTISWEVLWLVAGGIALGLAIEKTGLANTLVSSIPFSSLKPYVVVVIGTLTGFLMANFMSHTATANLLLPLLAALGTSVKGLEAAGGATLIVLSTTIAISLGMSLPISSPPNALAHATGEVETKHLAKAGIAVGLLGLVINFLTMTILQLLNFF